MIRISKATKSKCIALLLLFFIASIGAKCNEAALEKSLVVTEPCQSSGSSVTACGIRETGQFNLFNHRSLGARYGAVDNPSVENVVEKGLYAAGAAPAHIAFQGPARQGSVRCAWRGIARTPQQREDSIKFWLGIDNADDLPSPSELMDTFNFYIDMMHPSFQDAMRANFSSMAYGGLSTDALFLTCYVDYDVRGYILGDGPSIVTVAYDQMGESRSYELYKLSHAAGRYGPEPFKSESEYQSAMQSTVSEKEASIRNVVEGRESVVFLAPMGAHFAIAIEAWQAIAQWDLQLEDDGTVNAVRYGTGDYDPEHSQALSSLESRVRTAAQRRRLRREENRQCRRTGRILPRDRSLWRHRTIHRSPQTVASALHPCQTAAAIQPVNQATPSPQAQYSQSHTVIPSTHCHSERSEESKRR